jgi:hypothetical protein
MPIEFDPTTSEIRYEGQVVGRYDYKDGVSRVSLNLTYECGPEEWVVPLSWFAYGLAKLEKHQPRENTVAMVVNTDETDIAEEYPVLRLLTERTVRQAGYIWVFHKSDADHWPSALHAHDYDKNMKLDALTGDIYDAATKQLCAKLKAKKLEEIHRELRQSKDFADKIAQLLGQ